MNSIFILRRSLHHKIYYFIKPTVRQVSNSSCYMNNLNILAVRGAAKRIVWVDLEMTGLDIEKDHIMEIACLVTDSQLNVVAKAPSIIIHQPENVLRDMHEWCVKQHGQSGLTEACRRSNISLQKAEDEILKFVSSHVPEKKCPLGGNSVYMDRLFIRKYMPKFNDYLHYRIIDVSSIKELAKRWFPKEFSNVPQKRFSHRTLDDILDSIEELKYYRQHIFKNDDVELEN